VETLTPYGLFLLWTGSLGMAGRQSSRWQAQNPCRLWISWFLWSWACCGIPEVNTGRPFDSG
jgi:hypothetical protein